MPEPKLISAKNKIKLIPVYFKKQSLYFISNTKQIVKKKLIVHAIFTGSTKIFIHKCSQRSKIAKKRRANARTLKIKYA
jgi:hypothetical protein